MAESYDANHDGAKVDEKTRKANRLKEFLARKNKNKQPTPASQESTPEPKNIATDQKKSTLETGRPNKRVRLTFGDPEEEDEKLNRQPKRPKSTDKQETNNITYAAPGGDQDEELDPLDAFMDDMQDAQDTTEHAEQVMEGDDENVQNAPEEEEEKLGDVLANFEKKKKKDLPLVDHSKIDYIPFRKNFYVEPSELSEMSNEEVDLLRIELDGIKVRGRDCPKPVQKWGQFGIPVGAMKVIEGLNYDKPSAIQSQAIPAVMSGRDVIGVAKTGSGKTMAFLLPMLRHIKDQPPLKAGDGPIALIMTPTRELALQIYRECKRFLKPLNLRAACLYGGGSMGDQIGQMKHGAEIVVCTPGRMIDMLVNNSGRVTNLRRVTYLVLDEADRMFDMGFEPQVTKIVRNTRPDRQTVLFSATFPRQMEALARKILNKFVEIVVGARSMVAPEVTQLVEICETDEDKFYRALELLGQLFDTEEDVRALIFVNRQERADALMIKLQKRGYACVATHAGREQIDRRHAIQDFERGNKKVLIATSIAARGLDVKQLKLVINYDPPDHLEDYVHRVGRTGRAGQHGTAVSFLANSADTHVADVVKAMKSGTGNNPVPPKVQQLYDEFMAKVKSGNARYSRTGYKGKGLDKLDEERNAQKSKTRAAYGDQANDDNENNNVNNDGEGREDPDDLAKYDIGPEAVIIPGKFYEQKKGRANHHHHHQPAPAEDDPECHAKFQTNAFPSKARWFVTNGEMHAKIGEEYGVSLTNKGQYYPPGKEPAGESDEPKLYVLIEGQSANAVYGAYEALKKQAIQGIKQAGAAGVATNRYDVI